MHIGSSAFIIYGLFSIDLFKMSYNCYIHRYLQLSLAVISSDVDKIGNALIKSTKKLLGIENEVEKLSSSVFTDPSVLLQVLPQQTLLFTLFQWVSELIPVLYCIVLFCIELCCTTVIAWYYLI